MSYKINIKHPERKEMLRRRRIRQLDKEKLRPYLHSGKWNGEDLRKIRQRNGVGTVKNFAQAAHMNEMWKRTNDARIKREKARAGA